MSQIKLIATDLDGTLLDGEEKVPDRFLEQIDLFTAQGIKMVIASGRQYFNIKNLFEHHTDQLYYIGDNGALGYYQNKPFHTSFLRWETAFELVKRGKAISGVTPLISAEHNTFFEKDNDDDVKFIRQFYKQCILVNDFSEIDTQYEKPLKVAFYDNLGVKNNSLKHLKNDIPEVVPTQSNVKWLDIAPTHTNKGEALKTLQEILDISPEETMAFGDYHNDIEMLKRAKYSFAVSSAQDDVKKVANYICDSNTNLGIIKVMDDLLENPDIHHTVKRYQ